MQAPEPTAPPAPTGTESQAEAPLETAATPPASPAADATRGQRAALAAECPRRIYIPTADARLIALNAETGEVCTNFAKDGVIDLSANMPNWDPGSYYSTSAPVIAHGLIVVGGAVNDNVSTTEQSGVIRAYDVDTGALVWNWDSGNPDQTAAARTGRDLHGELTERLVDAQRRQRSRPRLRAARQSAAGPVRRQPLRERRALLLLRRRARPRQRRLRWVFQTVHHDLWDYDVPAQPTLVDLTVNGAAVQALVQATKQGEIFVLNRETGEPILPVEERPAPQGAADGDHTAPTQPRSALSFDPEPLTGATCGGSRRSISSPAA